MMKLQWNYDEIVKRLWEDCDEIVIKLWWDCDEIAVTLYSNNSDELSYNHCATVII